MRCTGEWVGLDRAAGRISRGTVAPYPPGIPVVCPGEIIVEDIVHYVYNIIKEGGTVYGLNESLEINAVDWQAG
jgi:arginine decarboxylase